MRPTVRGARRRGGGAAATAPSGALFFDDFSSGDLSKSSAYFSWGGTYNTAVISGFSRAGNTGNCLRFNFGGVSGSQVSEQRFFFGPTIDSSGATTLHHSEVWLRYYVYFPSGTESPSVGPKAENANASNNKFMRCYALPESDYPRYGASFYRGATYNLASVAAGDAGVGGQAGLYPGTGTVTELTGAGAVAAGVVNDTTRGTWLKIEWYCKRSSLGDVGHPNGDGVLTMWLNDVQQFSYTTINSFEATPTGAVSGFDGGYLFGAQDAAWTNAGTYVYLDDFAYSTTGRV